MAAAASTVRVGFVSEFDREGARKCVSGPAGDTALVIVAGGQLRAVEARCHHMGHSLEPGDIEELGGRHVIICPAHKRRIDLATGACVDTGLDERRVEHVVEKMQRVFPVAVNGDGSVWVDFGSAPAERASALGAHPFASDGYVTPPQASPLGAAATEAQVPQLNMLAFRQRKRRAMEALRAKHAFLSDSPSRPHERSPGAQPTPSSHGLRESSVGAGAKDISMESPASTPPARAHGFAHADADDGKPKTQRTLESFFQRVAD